MHKPHLKNILWVLSIIFLIIWCAWWGVSFHRQHIQGGRHLWFPPAFGVDFYYHVDLPARIWWTGGNPYAEKSIENGFFFPYPPTEMRLFAWVNMMTPKVALLIWLSAMATIVAAAAWSASRWRRRLQLNEIQPLTAVTLALWSTPFLFAMERGQYDPLSLLVILAALPLLSRKSNGAQFLAGAVLCFAPWIKVYPGLIFVGLLGLRRWWASLGFIVSGLVIAIYFFYTGEMQNFLVNNTLHMKMADDLALSFSGELCLWNHPLPTALAGIWLNTKFSGLGLLTGKVLSALILLAGLFWVTYHVYHCPNRDVLAYPYFLWIVALATFAPQISNDYNLVFLPLAVLTVWDRRDPVPVHIALALLLIWWQPVRLPINADLLMGIKILGVGAVAVCLVNRAREQTQFVAGTGVHQFIQERGV